MEICEIPLEVHSIWFSLSERKLSASIDDSGGSLQIISKRDNVEIKNKLLDEIENDIEIARNEHS